MPDEASGIVVFIDYNCIFCRRQFQVFEAMAAEGRPPRVILRHLPHSVDSIALAQALLAARQQGGAEALHRVMAAADQPLGPGDLPDLARAAGLDPERLRADAASPEIEALLDGDVKLAWSLRIESTPTMVVGTELRRGVQSGDALAALTAAAAGR
ncbi:DsbA family protein [Azospirillum thermophilum]|uniref:DsbA family protein n=1 Tax=Azospirillum thermophilum TaxID=2202148 RepID=UPI001FE2D21F|nr:DsbA family protein [Azospirillum thermophilum]